MVEQIWNVQLDFALIIVPPARAVTSIIAKYVAMPVASNKMSEFFSASQVKH